MTAIIGLTGGIATGKSTVARLFAEAGCYVIDADQIARQAVRPKSSGLRQIVNEFGLKILTNTGELDRSKLGNLVFNDSNQMTKLNAIVQPIIRDLIKQAVAKAKLVQPRAIILDAPLLLEQHYESMVDVIVVVTVPENVQRDRLMVRNHLNGAQARARIASQMPLADKEKLADFVISNTGTIEATKQHVIELLDHLSDFSR
ncbi:dephospho-CoA kinase [Furfurilactobacillus curtus]|uniref:Dephospho-CoA kinase n=1 Tax=Furfurilactobacillus curtus TaxID=1746200 RepID=A0ABQ5JLG4_9LACO